MSDPRRERNLALPLVGAKAPGAAIHRPFFLAALAIVLSAGAGWGVLLLWKIGQVGSFTGVTVHEVNAHGHAQIMGWVGLFIMGFAYQVFPPLWRVVLPAPRLALASLGCMVVGIACRSAGMAAAGETWAMPLHHAGLVFEAVAVGTFLSLMLTALVRSGQRISPSVAFIATALAFLLLQTLFSGWHAARLLGAPNRDELLRQIATFQAPLRDVQIHGMAMLMIFGVGLRVFPMFFGFAEVPVRRAWTAYGLLAAAVLLEVGLFLGYRATESRAFAGAMLAPWLLLPIGAWLLIGAWKPWRLDAQRVATPERSLKFVRTAFIWLFVSFGLLLAMPAYLMAYDGPFSHAYHGAIRHAITVGFVSLMIMGMGAKLVAEFKGLDPHRLPRLWGPFLLVNAGCLLRVGVQIATDWIPIAFPFIAISGALEWTGLAWWAAHLAAAMLRSRGYRPPAAYEVPRAAPR